MALVNIVVALIMTRFIDVAGIAFATGISGWVQCFFLWRGLRGEETASFDERLKFRVPRIFLCTFMMGACLFGITFFFKDWFYGHTFYRFLALGILTGTGGVVYFGMAHFTHVFRLNDLKKYLRRRQLQPKEVDMIEEVNDIG